MESVLYDKDKKKRDIDFIFDFISRLYSTKFWFGILSEEEAYEKISNLPTQKLSILIVYYPRDKQGKVILKVKKSKKVIINSTKKDLIEDIDVDIDTKNSETAKSFLDIIDQVEYIKKQPPFSTYSIDSEHTLSGTPGTMLGLRPPPGAYTTLNDMLTKI